MRQRGATVSCGLTIYFDMVAIWYNRAIRIINVAYIAFSPPEGPQADNERRSDQSTELCTEILLLVEVARL